MRQKLSDAGDSHKIYKPCRVGVLVLRPFSTDREDPGIPPKTRGRPSLGGVLTVSIRRRSCLGVAERQNVDSKSDVATPPTRFLSEPLDPSVVTHLIS